MAAGRFSAAARAGLEFLGPTALPGVKRAMAADILYQTLEAADGNFGSIDRDAERFQL